LTEGSRELIPETREAYKRVAVVKLGVNRVKGLTR